MIVVRYVFQIKFGRNDAMLKAYKEIGPLIREELPQVRRSRVLTDLSGPFFTIVNELEFESLAAWEASRPAMFSSRAMRELMALTGDTIESGHAEFYNLEDEVLGSSR
jgi:hypothetical protein